MRDIGLYKHPVAEPGVCGKCGSQKKDWFVDLGFQLESVRALDEPLMPDTMWYESGVVYLCCDCLNDIIVTTNRKFEQFEQDHSVKVPLHGRELLTGIFIGPDDPELATSGGEEGSSETSGEVNGDDRPTNGDGEPFRISF